MISVVYTGNYQGTIPKVNSTLKALGFGGSVPYAFLHWGEGIRGDMIRLQTVRTEDRELLWNINQKYLYEMTNFYDDLMDEYGNYHYGHFDEYFSDLKRIAYFIFNDDTMVGFAMICPYSNIGQNPDFTMAEFTIFPSFRKKHLALESVKKILERHPGKWEIKYNEKNIAAKKLWNMLTAPFEPKQYSLNEEETVLSFETETRTTHDEIRLELHDAEWPFEYTDHDRTIVRAIVFDDEGFLYFIRANRDDEFGRAILIETSGGGVEEGENLLAAIKRELREELGADIDVICKLGVVSDYYNLIHRHNLNHYFLCRAVSFGEKHLTRDEIDSFHLSTLRLSYDEAVCEYEKRRETRLGRLLANRELPILRKAWEIMNK